MNILIVGAPGSGKGTQAELIAKKLNIPTISTGAMLRAAISEGSELGVKAQEIINAGKLVTDDIMIALVLERILKDDCKNGFILDGFPRTLTQAEAIERAGIKIDMVLHIDLSDCEVIERISGRRVCGECGLTYHVKYNPPKNEGVCGCGGLLEVRDDDREDTVKSRLDVYHTVTAPVIEFYKKLDKVVGISSVGSVEETTKSIFEVMGI